VQLQALESNANSTRTMYEAFVQRLRQSQNLDEAQTPESRIISSAPTPLRPAGPKRLLMVGASVPLGLILGVLAALIAEKLAPLMPVKVNGAPRATLVPPHRRATTAPMTMWRPVLGEINDPAALAAADYVLDYPASKYAKTMAHLVHELEAKSGGGAIIALTSADDGESRSAIAVSLARAAARMGKKTVILDCAPLPLSSRAMKVAAKTGLYEVLSGSAILSQALAKDPRSKACLLAASRWPGNAASMFASRAMARLISVLRGGADFVVIDCGPVGAEAATVTRLADATVLVSKRGMLHSPLMAQAARALENVRAAPVGIVVTR
jgi:succinoglycan biosynthesis transport protein ExoP